MDSIQLSDGRTIEVGSFANDSAGHLHIRVNMSMADAVSAFSTGTDRIVYQLSDGSAYAVSGFTKISYLVNEPDCVRVVLERPVILEDING